MRRASSKEAQEEQKGKEAPKKGGKTNPVGFTVNIPQSEKTALQRLEERIDGASTSTQLGIIRTALDNEVAEPFEDEPLSASDIAKNKEVARISAKLNTKQNDLLVKEGKAKPAANKTVPKKVAPKKVVPKRAGSGDSPRKRKKRASVTPRKVKKSPVKKTSKKASPRQRRASLTKVEVRKARVPAKKGKKGAASSEEWEEYFDEYYEEDQEAEESS